jgi:hypothetical protein|tara:strand:- start:74 stop:298 length:225 start_codon:yes stop_codon:yes gene_type:complete
MTGEVNQTININDTEYKESDLTPSQIVMVNHVSDLDKKILKHNFELQQLQFGREAFMNALNQSLETNELTPPPE